MVSREAGTTWPYNEYSSLLLAEHDQSHTFIIIKHKLILTGKDYCLTGAVTMDVLFLPQQQKSVHSCIHVLLLLRWRYVNARHNYLSLSWWRGRKNVGYVTIILYASFRRMSCCCWWWCPRSFFSSWADDEMETKQEFHGNVHQQLNWT